MRVLEEVLLLLIVTTTYAGREGNQFGNSRTNWNEDHNGLGGGALGSANDVVKPSEQHLEGIPKLVKKPPPVTYVKPRQNVRVECIADPTNFVNIFCNNKIVKREKLVKKMGVRRKGNSYRITFYINVSFREVHEWFGKEDYWCRCEAWNEVPKLKAPKMIRGPKTYIKMAYMEERFQFSPMPSRKEAGPSSMHLLQCTPPRGHPTPKVFWQKNGKIIQPENDERLTVDHQGSLIIHPVELSDAGNYTCVAENIAGRLVSEPAQFTVYVNGGWSTWTPWSDTCSARCFHQEGYECPKVCSNSQRERSRSCTKPVPVNGGRTCLGTSVENEQCDINCNVNGKWSEWSPWTICNTNCKRTRQHSCTNPRPKNNGRPCQGSHLHIVNCTNGECQPVATKHISDFHDVAMYIGLFVAIAVLLTVIIVIAYLIRRKSVTFGRFDAREMRFRNHVNGENGALASKDKKAHDLLIPPDLTQSVVTIKNNKAVEQVVSTSSGGGASVHPKPLLDSHQGLRVILPNSSTYQSISGQKGAARSPRISGSNCGSNSGMDSSGDHKSRPCSALYHELSLGRHSQVFANFLPANVDVEAMAWGTIGNDGGRLCLPDSGISLTIPGGALQPGQSEDVFLAVCREEHDRPQLSDRQTMLSPVVLCGPPGISMTKPVVISFPHSACLKQGFWSITVLSSDSPCDEQGYWQEMVTLGQETLNTPGFCQLDSSMCHLMTEQLQRYCLIGESLPGGNAVKVLRLAAFAAPLSSSVDYNLRVYMLSDTKDAFENVVDMENRLGGYLLDTSKQLLFRDGGHNLCFCIEELSIGWRSKAKYQEIPFQHIWSGNQSGVLHCSFSLEHVDPTRQSISCKIVVYQNHFYSNRQVVHIISNKSDLTQQSNASSNCSPALAGVLAGSKISPPRAGASAALPADPMQSTFRLPLHLKRRLCHLLDTPNSRGNDWRMLARQLAVDRYINFFATKSSPTECIFDLWEARHREQSAVSDLVSALRTMGRADCATILETEPAIWL